MLIGAIFEPLFARIRGDHVVREVTWRIAAAGADVPSTGSAGSYGRTSPFTATAACSAGTPCSASAAAVCSRAARNRCRRRWTSWPPCRPAHGYSAGTNTPCRLPVCPGRGAGQPGAARETAGRGPAGAGEIHPARPAGEELKVNPFLRSRADPVVERPVAIPEPHQGPAPWADPPLERRLVGIKC
jgi:hypothetical protein